jgi:Ser/Thr protein kinase RdoA (MazF antagonist)
MPGFSELSAAEQVERFRKLALAAVCRWALEAVRVEPIKVRENAVFAVHLADGGKVVMRVHRMGYHSDEALRSEQLWMRALSAAHIEVPRALPSKAGNSFELVEVPGVPGQRQVDVFAWIDGQQLGSVVHGAAATAQSVARIYCTVGALAARIHKQACEWSLPAEFRRHAWDAEGLAGEKPFWGRFWELEALSSAERALFERTKAKVFDELTRFGTQRDRYSLIHADLVPENILVESNRVRIIDFDDAGFGWHMFEIATSLYFIRRESWYEDARAAVIAGYRSVRPLPDAHVRLLPLFLAARGTTYLAWVHTRQGEAVVQELTPQLIELAVATAEDYLSTAN